jgi:hypothetical protein
MRSRMNATPMRLEEVVPQLPGELCAIINRTLARRPGDRWPQAATLSAALRELPVASERTAS